MGSTMAEKSKKIPPEQTPAGLVFDFDALALSDDDRSVSKNIKDGEEDGSLFDAPERPDCDICMAPMPLEQNLCIYMNCCGKTICCGCFGHNQRVNEVAHYKKLLKEQAMAKRKPKPQAIVFVTCAFCRKPLPRPGDNEDYLRRTRDRMARNDARGFKAMANFFREGEFGLPVNEAKEVEYFSKAAELGLPDALLQLASWYEHGAKGFEKDMKKAAEYYEAAARKGDVTARVKLGELEAKNGRMDLAIKHWQISAAAGDKPSVDVLTALFPMGHISKKSLEESIRARFFAWKAMQSDERDLYVLFRKGREEENKTKSAKYYQQWVDLLLKMGKHKEVEVLTAQGL